MKKKPAKSKSRHRDVVLFCYGEATPEGAAGVGAVLVDESIDHTFFQLAHPLGQTGCTRHDAEYGAVVLGLLRAKRFRAKRVTIRTNSSYVFNRLKRGRRPLEVEDALREHHQEICLILGELEYWDIELLRKHASNRAEPLAQKAITRARSAEPLPKFGVLTTEQLVEKCKKYIAGYVIHHARLQLPLNKLMLSVFFHDWGEIDQAGFMPIADARIHFPPRDDDDASTQRFWDHIEERPANELAMFICYYDRIQTVSVELELVDVPWMTGKA